MLLEAQLIINSLQASFVVTIGLRLKHGVIVGGVDEAGRGSVIGPMVVAGVAVSESKLAELRRMGVRDSKKLTPRARARLFGDIVRTVDSVCVRKVEPAEIDECVMFRGLNTLEARVMAGVIDSVGADEVYVDSCDVKPARFKDSIEQRMVCRPRRIHSLHRADSLNVAVSAASIIAKITRDQEIQELRNKYGPGIGSGYPSDATTIDFLRNWIAERGEAPEFARKSWKPVRHLLAQGAQCTLYVP